MKQRQRRHLPEVDRINFYRCPACGEMVDRRQMDEVTIHHSHVLHPHRWSFDGRETKPVRWGPVKSTRRDPTAQEAEIPFRN